MKKVGIITLYEKTYNYGAQLQAYALQKVISSLHFDCELIRFMWMNRFAENSYENINNLSEGLFLDFFNSIPHSSNSYDSNSIFNANNNYDIFVCGSDQIWGCEDSLPTYNLPLMTLGFADDSKNKVGYAISFGGAILDNRRALAVKSAASSLDSISVREHSSTEFVENLVGKNVQTVVDPTLLLTKEDWGDFVKLNHRDYVLVYTITNNSDAINYANLLADKLGCGVEVITYTNNRPVGTKEFVSLIANCKFMITDSYHGTIFSIIFNKQFFSMYIEPSESNFSKNIRIKDLLIKFDLINRYISFEDNIIQKYTTAKSIDYSKINVLVKNAREKSIAFLNKALMFNKKNASIGNSPKFCNPYELYIDSLSQYLPPELLSYEKCLLEKEILRENQIFSLIKQKNMWNILSRIERCISENYKFKDIDVIKEHVIIYGLGMIGKRICELFSDKLIAIVDEKLAPGSYNSFKILKIDDDSLAELIIGKKVTFIVTPTWDKEIIARKIINRQFIDSNVVFIDNILPKYKI